MWQDALGVDVLKEGTGTTVFVPGRKKPVAVFRCQGAFFAVADECTHAGAPLSESRVVDYIITCPMHGAKFDVRTGEGIGPQAYAPLRVFPARTAGGKVQVEI